MPGVSSSPYSPSAYFYSSDASLCFASLFLPRIFSLLCFLLISLLLLLILPLLLLLLLLYSPYSIPGILRLCLGGLVLLRPPDPREEIIPGTSPLTAVTQGGSDVVVVIFWGVPRSATDRGF